MKKLHFSINIQASIEKVWRILWNEDTYPPGRSKVIAG